MNKESICQFCKIDDWGVCTWKYMWKEDCDDNCFLNKDKEEQNDIKKRDVNNINLRIENIDFWSPNTGNKGGMRIYWNSDIGFGTLDIVKVAGNDGEDFDSPYEEMKLNAYTETMDCNEDKSFIRKILSLVADYLNVID